VLHVGRALGNRVAHLFKNLEVLLFGVLLGHAAGGNVIQVLQPFEVRAGHTTAVCKHVGHSDNASREKCLLSSKGSWAVGTFNNNFALKVSAVLLVDNFLNGSWDEDITLKLHEIGGVHVCLSGGSVVALKGATLVPPILN